MSSYRRIDLPTYIVGVKPCGEYRTLMYEYVCEDCGEHFEHFTPTKYPRCAECEKRATALKIAKKKEEEAKRIKRETLKTVKEIIKDIQTMPSKDNVIHDRNSLVKELEKKYLEIKGDI